MIVQRPESGGLWCINQTAHAVQTAELTRHFGNDDFAPAAPAEIVQTAIAQHDNGWAELDLEPILVGGDNRPADFLTEPWQRKLMMWQRGVLRGWSQHPYIAVLISNHAATLYERGVEQLDGDELLATLGFISDHETLVAYSRAALADDVTMVSALSAAAIEAHTRLLQFGDAVSLQLCVPWPSEMTHANVPCDLAGSTTDVTVSVDGDVLQMDPWPYDVDQFETSVLGRRLATGTFADVDSYRTALADAPLTHQRWTVVPAPGA